MLLAHHKTKIVCTIGPASQSKDMLKQLALNGMSVARLNFAHGEFEGHREVISALRETAQSVGKRIAILADLPGPKMRIGKLEEESIELERGAGFILTTRNITGDRNRVSVSLEKLPRVVEPGATIFLNDGFIQLLVEKVEDREVYCKVLVGGELRSHKGVNVPGIDLGVSAFTDFDRECLRFAADQKIDAVSISFVQGPDDIADVRAAAAELGYSPFIISKIERSRALENIDEILKATDGVMVARGDLGVEIPIEEIAITQKQLIHKANLLGKPIITATQMLESMVDNRRPTRAEVTDVANAILDGADCVMLSEESAMGAFPAEAVAMLARIAEVTEPRRTIKVVRQDLFGDVSENKIGVQGMVALNISYSVEHLSPLFVITPTKTGATSRRVSRFRLPVWILALSRYESTCQTLQFSYGVHGICVTDNFGSWETCARNVMKDQGVAKGLVIMTQGPPSEKEGGTNSMKILDLSEES